MFKKSGVIYIVNMFNEGGKYHMDFLCFDLLHEYRELSQVYFNSSNNGPTVVYDLGVSKYFMFKTSSKENWTSSPSTVSVFLIYIFKIYIYIYIYIYIKVSQIINV